MMDRRQIVELWKRGKSGGAAGSTAAGVLVTLVRLEGSSYRRPGARLLTAAGTHAGTISGGCLEADVVRRAAWIAREGAAIERYATSFDDTSEIPYGLGCGGTVDLLFEPVSAPEGEALLAALAGALEGRAATVVSFLPDATRTLRRVIFDGSGEVLFASAALTQHKIDCARTLTPGTIYEGRFVERLEPPQRLFVLGAGDDAKPLVELASLLGWTVTVAEGRAQLAQAERFPRAHHVLRMAEGEGLDIGGEDAVILMTHSYEQDRDLLTKILPQAPRYLGLLGSRHRSSLLVAEAAVTLGRTIASCCACVFAPVGMDLGGDGPEAIALAIVAEVQAVASGRMPISRRLSAADVAEQIEQGGASRYLLAQCALEA